MENLKEMGKNPLYFSGGVLDFLFVCFVLYFCFSAVIVRISQ